MKRNALLSPCYNCSMRNCCSIPQKKSIAETKLLHRNRLFFLKKSLIHATCLKDTILGAERWICGSERHGMGGLKSLLSQCHFFNPSSRGRGRQSVSHENRGETCKSKSPKLLGGRKKRVSTALVNAFDSLLLLHHHHFFLHQR